MVVDVSVENELALATDLITQNAITRLKDGRDEDAIRLLKQDLIKLVKRFGPMLKTE